MGATSLVNVTCRAAGVCADGATASAANPDSPTTADRTRFIPALQPSILRPSRGFVHWALGFRLWAFGFGLSVVGFTGSHRLFLASGFGLGVRAYVGPVFRPAAIAHDIERSHSHWTVRSDLRNWRPRHGRGLPRPRHEA